VRFLRKASSPARRTLGVSLTQCLGEGSPSSAKGSNSGGMLKVRRVELLGIMMSRNGEG